MRLIINADDFGATKAVNRAVVEAFNRGILTSCSIMASGEAFDDAVLRVAQCPGLGVGLHLVAVHGRSVLPHYEIPSLVDRAGRFPDDPTLAGLRYYFSRRARRELFREFTAQFERALAANIPLTHMDSHLHLHVHPMIFKLALELGIQYGVRRMRVPDDDFELSTRFDDNLPRARAVEAKIFRILTRRMKRRLSKEGFAFTDRVYGHFLTGRMSEAYLLYLLDHLNVSTGEIYCHPALFHNLAALDDSGRQCLREYEALVSQRVLERMDQRGVTRVRYSDLSL
ncbi:MAG: hopanoid biosynthesis-associated protein HpnK [Syntrophobacteraceae bacterium]